MIFTGQSIHEDFSKNDNCFFIQTDITVKINFSGLTFYSLPIKTKLVWFLFFYFSEPSIAEEVMEEFMSAEGMNTNF